ncbi:MAG TPA: DUF3124 domain-containing protein [Bacteroidales bacterium]
MKYLAFIVAVLLSSCSHNQNKEISSINPVNWQKRAANHVVFDSLTTGKSYLPVYSQIYQLNENRTYDLTVTVSLRNISLSDTIYILNADYYNTSGEKIRNYFNTPIYLLPMETVEIIIDELDREGGTGDNFVFGWAVKNEKNLPFFEAVMISTTGQQGLSFTTRGIRIFE